MHLSNACLVRVAVAHWYVGASRLLRSRYLYSSSSSKDMGLSPFRHDPRHRLPENSFTDNEDQNLLGIYYLKPNIVGLV